MWDELGQAATQLAMTASAEREDDRAGTVAHVDITDFQQLEPALTAVGLDQDFVSCWRASMPITPAWFAETLLYRLDAAHADVALYPDDAGSVDVALRDAGATALLQFSWSSKDELHVDEIRIPDVLAHTGLFQRMMFNTERLAAMLGFKRVTLLASRVGSYAFAAMGYPRDPELYQAMRHSRH